MGSAGDARNALRIISALLVMHVRYDVLPPTLLPGAHDEMSRAACYLPLLERTQLKDSLTYLGNPQGLAAQPPQGSPETRCAATCDEMRSDAKRDKSSSVTRCVGVTHSATTYDDMRCDMIRHI